MNKTQLIDALAARFEGNRKAAAHALESVLDTITREVAKGEKVAITGFGSFEKRVRDARWVRNPPTGERIKAKKTAVPKFSAGADLKDVVSGAKKLPKLTLLTTAAAAKKAAAEPTAGAVGSRQATPASKASDGQEGDGGREDDGHQAAPAKKTPAKKATAKKARPRRRRPRSRRPRRRRRRRSRRPRRQTAKKSTTKKAAPGQGDGHAVRRAADAGADAGTPRRRAAKKTGQRSRRAKKTPTLPVSSASTAARRRTASGSQDRAPATTVAVRGPTPRASIAARRSSTASTSRRSVAGRRRTGHAPASSCAVAGAVAESRVEVLDGGGVERRADAVGVRDVRRPPGRHRQQRRVEVARRAAPAGRRCSATGTQARPAPARLGGSLDAACR